MASDNTTAVNEGRFIIEMLGNTEVKVFTQEQTKKHQGSKWIRKEKRAKIYLRDSHKCGYCQKDLSDEKVGNYKKMRTLDHIIGKDEGRNLAFEKVQAWGTSARFSINHQSNLITSCEKCNKMKGSKNVQTFLTSLENLDIIENAELRMSEILSQVQIPLSRGTK